MHLYQTNVQILWMFDNNPDQVLLLNIQGKLQIMPCGGYGFVLFFKEWLNCLWSPSPLFKISMGLSLCTIVNPSWHNINEFAQHVIEISRLYKYHWVCPLYLIVISSLLISMNLPYICYSGSLSTKNNINESLLWFS